VTHSGHRHRTVELGALVPDGVNRIGLKAIDFVLAQPMEVVRFDALDVTRLQRLEMGDNDGCHQPHAQRVWDDRGL
jgi:hypothetical protein